MRTRFTNNDNFKEDLTDGDCLIGEVEVVVAGPSCDRSRQVTDVCSGTESSVSPSSDMSGTQ